MIPLSLRVLALPQTNVYEVAATPGDPVVSPYTGALTSAFWTGKDRDGVDVWKVGVTRPDGVTLIMSGVRLDDVTRGIVTDQSPQSASSRFSYVRKNERIGTVASVPSMLLYAADMMDNRIGIREAIPEVVLSFATPVAPAPESRSPSVSVSAHTDLMTPLLLGLIIAAVSSDNPKKRRRASRRGR